MKILYDHQAFTMQNFGGVSKIFYELVNHLRGDSDVALRYPVMFSNNDYIYKDKTIGAFSFFKNQKFTGRGTILTKLQKANKLLATRAIKNGDYDIFHPTYYDPYYLDYNIRKPIVVTCYDLIHEKYKQNDVATLAWKEKTLKSASKIIAISHNTKSDLVQFYNIPEEKVAVVHLGSSFEVREAAKRPQPERQFFLYVGNRDGYKNFDFFVRSIAPVLQTNSDLHLYCAGGLPFNKEELMLFAKLKVDKQIAHFKGDNDTLQALYSDAIALFYPSLYEGFGIPLLEAMACSCPVVTSSKSSLPEVGGDAALYFDPLSEESILNAANKILNDEELRENLKVKGRERLENFSWKKAAETTYKVYKSML